MWCICYPFRRYNDIWVPYGFRTRVFREHNVINHCTKQIYEIVKKAIKEYNEWSTSPYYWFIAEIHRAHTAHAEDNKYKIEVTIGLTSIKKNRISQRWLIFPSLFERDKSLREDIVINYTRPGAFGWRTYHEEISFETPPYDRLKCNRRLKYLGECNRLNCQPDYQFYFLCKNHFCLKCFFNHADFFI
uniref:Transposase Tc5 C-terminal domain-containing protein n=1 Tax=Panagrolaimus superbus TaxID=310955 RepID=A0A914YA96_9BILA